MGYTIEKSGGGSITERLWVHDETGHDNIPGVPKKYRCLINNRTKAFCLIPKISFCLNKTQIKSHFETKELKSDES